MERQIKFRAWDGIKMHHWQPEYNEGVRAIFADGMTLINHIEQVSEYEFELLSDQVPDLKLMQYTGLKDKNGVLIYEGDIIKYYNHRFEKSFIHEVMYDVKYTSFSIPNIESMEDFEPEEGIEVIGNIYETPELLTYDR